MFPVKKSVFSIALITLFSSSSFAFFDELVVGATSVTNNLISSGASVTNNTVNTASTTMISLTSNPGKMADRVGLMADRIGFMADRIVTTEGLMAGLAHKVIDSNQQQRPVQQYASAYAPAPAAMPTGSQYGYANPAGYHNYPTASGPTASGNPYLAPPAQVVPSYGYSASQMIYGVAGSTYTAARTPAPAAHTYQPGYTSDFGFSARPAVLAAGNSCGMSYGVPRKC